MRELVVPGKGELQRDAEGLDGHDGHGADQGANSEVDQRVLLAVRRGDLVDHHEREYAHGAYV